MAGPRLSPQLCWCASARRTVTVPVPHRFLDFCKEKGGYTGCPFPATLEMEQGQNLLKDLSKLSSSTSGMAGPQAGQVQASTGGTSGKEDSSLPLTPRAPKSQLPLPGPGG